MNETYVYMSLFVTIHGPLTYDIIIIARGID